MPRCESSSTPPPNGRITASPVSDILTCSRKHEFCEEVKSDFLPIGCRLRLHGLRDDIPGSEWAAAAVREDIPGSEW